MTRITSERKAGNLDPDRKELNHHNRMLYHKEVADILTRLNSFLPENGPQAGHASRKVPSGHWPVGEWSVTGEKLTEEQFQQHLRDTLPRPEDYATLKDIFKDPTWIEDKAMPKDFPGATRNIRKSTMGK